MGATSYLYFYSLIRNIKLGQFLLKGALNEKIKLYEKNQIVRKKSNCTKKIKKSRRNFIKLALASSLALILPMKLNKKAGAFPWVPIGVLIALAHLLFSFWKYFTEKGDFFSTTIIVDGYKITINGDLCVGCPLLNEAQSNDFATAERIWQSCPVSAITIQPL